MQTREQYRIHIAKEREFKLKLFFEICLLLGIHAKTPTIWRHDCQFNRNLQQMLAFFIDKNRRTEKL